MSESLQASVVLVDHKVQFTGSLRSHPPLTIDYVPPLGDGQGYTPLELLLFSLAACSGATVATLLRRMQKDVSGLEVHVRGVRREQHPTGFAHIDLEFDLKSMNADQETVAKAIRLSEESFCPVWAMLKGSVEITATYTIAIP